MTRLLTVVCVIVGVVLPTTCGSVLHAVGSNVKNLGIYGGHDIPIENAPYMTALFGNFFGFRFFCGGTIVHENFILTAAHCMRRYSDVKVLVGADDLEDKDGVYFDVDKEFCNTEFIPYKNVNDICLLKLKEKIVFDDKVAKITLPDEDFKLEDNALVKVTGWGSTDNDVDEQHLRQVEIPIESQDSCRKVYEDLRDDMVCAGSKGHDACWGDSGGPLTYNDIQVGLVSYGDGCGRFSTVYTRVSSFINWINTTITENL